MTVTREEPNHEISMKSVKGQLSLENFSSTCDIHLLKAEFFFPLCLGQLEQQVLKE